MQRSPLLATAFLSLAWLAACDAPARENAPDESASLSASAQGMSASGDHRHVFELRDSQGARSAAGRNGGGTGISYHGGIVLQSGINIQAVYWASAPIYNGGPAAGTTGAGANDGSLVGYFLSHVGGSSHYNINSTYKNASGVALANAVNYVSYWANNQNVPAAGQSVSDAQIASMLQSGFTSGALTYDPNTLYTVFTAGTVNLGGGFGTQYCAYHYHATVNVPGVGSRTIYFAAMPYNNAYPSSCTAGTASPNGDPGADREVNTLVHEIEETQTDAMGTAWYDNRGYENADKCAWNFGTTYTTANGGVANVTIGGKNFLVQQNWINSGSGGCRIELK